MRWTSVSSYRHRKNCPAESSCRSRCFRAFTSARALRFWRPRIAGQAICTATIAAASAISPSVAQAQFPASFELSALDGTNGFAISAISAISAIDESDGNGRSVSDAGDVNGDGIDDLIIGADAADPNGEAFAGESYVVFGQTGGFPASFSLSTLDGTNGFVLNGVDGGDQSGFQVSGAGDVNGDGFDDLIIGTRIAASNVTLEGDESYVVFGQDGGFSSPFNLSTLNGANGFMLKGANSNDDQRSGFSVSGAGDVNGDSIDDVIIGAPFGRTNNSIGGESYVLFGRVTPELSLGDFDRDEDVDADDIDFYGGNLDQPASFNPELDLNNDGMITLADHDQHVTTLVQTSNGETGALLGDINLDGSVDVLVDAFILVANLANEGPHGHADGDLNADSVVDVLGDAFRLIGDLGQSNE